MTNFVDSDLSFIAVLGSISAALTCPSGSSAGSFPEQRLVVEPKAVLAVLGFISLNLWADACSVISPYMYC